jgi:hypothetical protein
MGNCDTTQDERAIAHQSVNVVPITNANIYCHARYLQRMLIDPTVSHQLPSDGGEGWASYPSPFPIFWLEILDKHLSTDG